MRKKLLALVLVLAAVLAGFARARASYDPRALYGKYSCLYVLTGNLTVVNNVQKTLTGWTQVFDNGGWYSAGLSTSRFTCPFTGTYYIAATVAQTGGNASDYTGDIAKNGVIFAKCTTWQGNAANTDYQPVNVIMYMNKGDYLEVVAENSSGADCTAIGAGATGGQTCYLSASYLSGQ